MAASRRPLAAGNWKMNGLSADGLALARTIADAAAVNPPACDLLVCPPATLVASVATALSGSVVAVGGQDCHAAESGAHTGDVAAVMLADAGASHVILGHSERRADHGEASADVRAKALAARAAGLTAVICIGESEAERDAGRTIDVVTTQLAESLPDDATAEGVVVAYEPVWAIGTGRTPTPAEVDDVHHALRGQLRSLTADGDSVRILYGGSVKPANASELMALANVDGALIGGASLDADAFLAIARSCG